MHLQSLLQSAIVIAGQLETTRISLSGVEYAGDLRGKSQMSSYIWIDVTTSFRWAKKPTGIPRTSNSIALRWANLKHPKLKFCIYNQVDSSFSEIDRSEVVLHLSSTRTNSLEKFDASSLIKTITHKTVSVNSPNLSFLRTIVKKLILRLPPEIREITREILRNGHALVRYTTHLTKWLATQSPIVPSQLRRWLSPLGKLSNLRKARFCNNDTLVSLGSCWSEAGYVAAIDKLSRDIDLKYVPLIYDVIPVIFPHFFDVGFSATFKRWAFESIRISNAILCISKNTKKDILDIAKAMNTGHPEVLPLRLGMDISDSALVADKYPDSANPFILCVGTLEVRKNHWLLYHVWRQLSLELGEETPTLVIAGQQGWLSSDVIHLLRFDPLIADRVKIFNDLDDKSILWLYENCLFTVYPSFYEGWGLPVAESLASGKYCISSDTSSLKEVAGELIDYCDPTDIAAWTNAIKKAHKDRGYIKDKEGQIKVKFSLQTWDETANEALQFVMRASVNPQAIEEAIGTLADEMPNGSFVESV